MSPFLHMPLFILNKFTSVEISLVSAGYLVGNYCLWQDTCASDATDHAQ